MVRGSMQLANEAVRVLIESDNGDAFQLWSPSLIYHRAPTSFQTVQFLRTDEIIWSVDDNVFIIEQPLS